MIATTHDARGTSGGKTLTCCLSAVLFAAVGCSGSDSIGGGKGGSGSAATGGNLGTGGTTASGGDGSTSTGGGGTISTGGTGTADGGRDAAGGRGTTAGNAATGGSLGSGGAAGTGGSTSAGGIGGPTMPSGGSGGSFDAGADRPAAGGSGGSAAGGNGGTGGSGVGGQTGGSTGNNWGIQDWRQLKYGMFIHYGMSTFDGVELSDGKTPVDRFRPTAQDVDQWVRVARDGGMKYAVLTAKHVAGFCLWDSKVLWKGAEYAYDVGASPVKTDIVGEFVKACAKYGIVPGIYYCTLDHHNSYPTTDYNPKLPYLTPEYFQLMQDHLAELHTRYPDIRITWIDIPRQLDSEQRTTLYNLVRTVNPKSLVEFNFGVESRSISGDYTIDIAAPVSWPTDILNSEVSIIKKPFQVQQMYQGETYELGYESCDKLNGDWFWQPGQSPRSVSSVTALYNSARAVNGNFLLDVPPDQTGQIPAASIQRLKDIRAALKLDPTTTATGLMNPPGR